MLCLLALVFAGDALSLGHGRYRVTSGDLNAMVGDLEAPALGVDSSRAEAPTTTLAIPEGPETTVPSGPADPPAPPSPPPLPLRPTRLDVDFPDPSAVWAGDRFYAFSTNSAFRNVQVSASTELLHWTSPVEAVPVLPAWARNGYTWARSVVSIGGQWVMYVSLSSLFGGGSCVDRLVATSPGGPYAPVDGGPLICDQTGGNGAIDPSVLITEGVPYLYWKADGARSQQLFGAALTPDGLAFAGIPQALLTATVAWQQSGIENPSMVVGGGAHWLLYSGAFWATGRYAMGYARCAGPLGPCKEMSGGGPWVSTRGDVVGPGGGAVFGGPEGALHLAYHAWAGGIGYAAGGRRVLHIENITVDANGPSILDQAPNGAMSPLVIGPAGVSVSGLAADPDTTDPVDVVVFLDGRQIANATAHPDFGAALALPADGPHRICVVAIDDLEQSRPELGCQDFTVSSLPFGALDTSSLSVSGWAIAPSSVDAISVDLYVDGTYVSSAPANLPRDDVATAWPAYGAAHGFSIPAPTAGPGPHVVCVYANAPDNQPAPQLGCITA